MSRRRASFKPCPTSSKTAFGTEQLADAAIARIRAEDNPLREQLPVRSYPCPCGHWHMTSKPLWVEPP